MESPGPRRGQSEDSFSGGTDFFKCEPPFGLGHWVGHTLVPAVRGVPLIRKRACESGAATAIVRGSGGEGRPADAIRTCAPYLAHVHISENDRSTPGTGGVNWAANFAALKEVGYDGWLVVEAFGLALPELVAATKIWRRMYQSEEQLARDGLAFMKSEIAKR